MSPTRVAGRANPQAISTSYVERHILAIRMQLRRFKRLTSAFSKKLGSVRAAMALHFAYDNFVRIHQTRKVRPTMAANITNYLWDLNELVSTASASL